MRPAQFFVVLSLIGLLVLHCGCAARQPPDYGPYLDHMPKSIVVLPPINTTAEVKASDAFLATITSPLAERGYYVFPIAMVDAFMKENGLPTPGEMHEIPLEKFGDVFGADAVLYIQIQEWTTKYLIIDSSTVVKLDYRLMDVKSGAELWRWQQTVTYSSSQGQSNPIGMVVAAGIHALTSPIAQRERQLAVYANNLAVNDPQHGMLNGFHHPDYEKDQQRRKAERVKGG